MAQQWQAFGGGEGPSDRMALPEVQPLTRWDIVRVTESRSARRPHFRLKDIVEVSIYVWNFAGREWFIRVAMLF